MDTFGNAVFRVVGLTMKTRAGNRKSIPIPESDLKSAPFMDLKKYIYFMQCVSE